MESSLFLLEGTHLLHEILKKPLTPTSVYATSSWIGKHPELVDLIPYSTSLYEVDLSILKSSLSTVNPDGVAALLPIDSLPKPRCDKSARFILAVDRLQDPGNLGTLFRTALAADVELVWLASGVDPLSTKVLRASAGACLHLPYERWGKSDSLAIENLVNSLKDASARGFQVVGTVVPCKSSVDSVLPYWELDWTKPTVLVLGNEGSGLHPLLIECCSYLVTLPHNPVVESLNVASAAVPLLLERRRAKMAVSSHQ